MNRPKPSQMKRLRLGGLACLFLLAFLPRAVYPVSRPLQWYFRSSEFLQAVLHRDWAGTLLAEHPGVSVMWLSGAAVWGWYGLQSLIGVSAPAPLDVEGYAFANRVAIGLLPLAVLIALGIVWGWFLLRRILGERVAWIGSVLWATDPFYLANSKALHLDATLSTLMILSALWMLVYIREHEQRQVLISAVLGGLAVLTKISAVFLIPFFGLVLLVDAIYTCATRDNAVSGIPALLVRSTIALGAWVLVAGLCFAALWPALWVQPKESIDLVVREGILSKVDQTHSLPRFYRGDLLVGDPGTRYYLDTILFRTTFLTLPFAVVGLGAGFRRQDRATTWLLASFVAFYFAQMALAGRKESRYMLPIILMLDVLAAQGLAGWLSRLAARPAVRTGLAAALLAAQSVVVFTRHPYYGTHYNLLAGGARVASRIFAPAEWGEGLDLAGQYVDRRLDPQSGTVGAQFLANEMVVQHVRADVRDTASVGDSADYLIFGTQYTTRGRAYDRWGELWREIYRFREPLFVAAFGGLPYAWVHQPGADPVVPRQIEARVGETTRLVGYRLDKPELVAPGDTLLVTLYWRAEAPIDEMHRAFVHLEGPNVDLIAQEDRSPEHTLGPGDHQGSDTLIEDPRELVVPSDAQAEDHTLWVGIYDANTMERLAAYDAAGSPQPDDRLFLSRIEIRRRVPVWWRSLSAAWCLMVTVGTAWSVVTARAARSL